MKKFDTVIKEYVNRLSLDNLKYLSLRLDERIAGDLADALEAISTCQDLDRWLASAKSHEEFYDMVDLIKDAVSREIVKRTPEVNNFSGVPELPPKRDSKKLVPTPSLN